MESDAHGSCLVRRLIIEIIATARCVEIKWATPKGERRVEPVAVVNGLDLDGARPADSPVGRISCRYYVT